MARRENLTVRELLIRLNGSRGHQKLIGTPEQIADVIETWFTTGASDGFNVMPATFPDGLEDFVDHVVPILRKPGTVPKRLRGDDASRALRASAACSGASAGVTNARLRPGLDAITKGKGSNG